MRQALLKRRLAAIRREASLGLGSPAERCRWPRSACAAQCYIIQPMNQNGTTWNVCKVVFSPAQPRCDDLQRIATFSVAYGAASPP
jgi:hypothetical protein